MLQVQLLSHYRSYLFTFLEVLACWSSNNARIHICADRCTPEFGLEVSVSDLVLLTQQRNRFHPHVDVPCPFLLLLPPNGVLGGRSSPSITITVTYLSCSQRAPVPDTQYPPTGTRLDATRNKPTAQLVILRKRLERISGGINHYEAHSSF